MKLALSICICLTAVLLGPSRATPFRPTKLGGETPELFWYINDSGDTVPALLHGINPHPSPNAIEDDVDFHLYNSKGGSGSTIIRPGCSGCLDGSVRGAPWVVLAHGFSSTHEGGFGDGLRNNFRQAPETMNLLFVNWGRLAGAPWYETAANNVPAVGAYTAKMIEFIISSGVASINDFHFAGHSLGSHVGGAVANALPLSMKLPVIHGLDPALPLFGVKPDSERLDPSDAVFVNVIHTAMGTLLDGGLAFTEPRGHVDFYPNSGKGQPGCGIDAFGSCSHSRAHEFFGESIHRRTAFGGCKCGDDWLAWDQYMAGCQCLANAAMGWATDRSARGIFFLRTNAQSPFGRDD